MKSKYPIQAKSTEQLLEILPKNFKLVNDKSSNGYKYVNLLYGAEVDEAREKLKDLYDNLFLDSMDLSIDPNLYEVLLSGTLGYSGYLNGNGINIKVTNDDEFYNGEPTRAIFLSGYGIFSTGNYKVLGLNYFRQSPRGSGYFIISHDIDEASGYFVGNKTALKIYLDNRGNTIDMSGFRPGIRTQSFAVNQSDEVLTPIDSLVLSGKYPINRTILISGVEHVIPHYEPYKGWIYDQNGNVTAVNDYFQEFEYDGDGNKIFHRTHMNNPFGSGNYNKQFFPLRNVPIEGTLKLYDMDILDISGNATEIDQGGTPIYQLKYSGMLIGTKEGNFEPVYKGYSQTVPSGRGYRFIEGDTANLLTTTSWDYQHVGSALSPESGVWIEPTTGELTNMISITNPQSRYIVEYKWKAFNKAKYISSFDATRFLSLDTGNPLYSLDNLSDNVFQIPFRFSKNPNYIIDGDGEKIDERSSVLTFDGWKYRPFSRLHKLEFSIPVIYREAEDIEFFHVPYKQDYIGYSPEFIPQINTIKSYIVNCPFDNDAPGYNATEDDLTGNSNFLLYTVGGTNKLLKVPYNNWYGKKIFYNGTSSSFFRINMLGKSFIKNNMFFKFEFKSQKNQIITLLDTADDALNQYILIWINSDGIINVESDGYNFISRSPISFDGKSKKVIVRRYNDDINPSVPIVEVFLKDKNFSFDVLKLFRQAVTVPTISSTFFHVYKNCSLDVNLFQLYYEAF